MKFIVKGSYMDSVIKAHKEKIEELKDYLGRDLTENENIRMDAIWIGYKVYADTKGVKHSIGEPVGDGVDEFYDNVIAKQRGLT